MRPSLSSLTGLALIAGMALPGVASAQARVSVSVSLPAIRFEVQPALVVVEPGIQVVPDHDHEVFFVGGYYWHRHEGHWYRARDWNHPKWKKWKHQKVPAGLRRLPPGKYRHHHPAARAAKVKKAHHKAEKRHHSQGKSPGKSGKSFKSGKKGKGKRR